MQHVPPAPKPLFSHSISFSLGRHTAAATMPLPRHQAEQENRNPTVNIRVHLVVQETHCDFSDEKVQAVKCDHSFAIVLLDYASNFA
jgi:hypothetical protein